MKKNEIIELNGQEYTLELNRESFVAIDKVCNVDKTFALVRSGVYRYIDEQELAEDYDPFANLPTDEEIEKQISEKEKAMNKLIERAFFVWLYPTYKYNINQVKEILKPYLETNDEKKSFFIGQKTGELLNKCIEIRDNYNQERKNLIAQINK